MPSFVPMSQGNPYAPQMPRPVATTPPQQFANTQPVSIPTGWQSKPTQQQPKTTQQQPKVTLAKPYPPAPVQPEPKFRGVSAEEKEDPSGKFGSVSLSLPAPDALGIAATTAPAPGIAPVSASAPLPGTVPVAAPVPDVVDWNITRARLNQLGATSFNLVRLAAGYRMVISLPTANPAQNHIVEVVADSEATAVATALQRAEQWVKK